MSNPAGIREIATIAKVSVGTVSNVINKPHLVSKRTLQRVRAVMEETGFVRNDLARQLRTGGGTTLGMIVLSVANPFFADLAHACEAVAEEAGYTVLLGSSDQLIDREDRYLALFEEQRVSGMLIAPVDGATSRMQLMHERGVRMVLFDDNADKREFCTVSLDGIKGGALALQHLIDTGRRHVTFAAGKSYLLEDRWVGAVSVLEAHPGVRLERLDTHGHTMDAGHAVGVQLAEMPADRRPDAVFAGNDQLAIGILHGLVMAGTVDVPRDIAVIGYDDIDYAASAIVPLTTIRQPIEVIAREALRLILAESSEADHRHEGVQLEPELIVRASTPRLSAPPGPHRRGRLPAVRGRRAEPVSSHPEEHPSPTTRAGADPVRQG